MALFSFPVIWIKTERGKNRATGLSEHLTTSLSMNATLSDPLHIILPLLPKPSVQFFTCASVTSTVADYNWLQKERVSVYISAGKYCLFTLVFNRQPAGVMDRGRGRSLRTQCSTFKLCKNFPPKHLIYGSYIQKADLYTAVQRQSALATYFVWHWVWQTVICFVTFY